MLSSSLLRSLGKVIFLTFLLKLLYMEFFFAKSFIKKKNHLIYQYLTNVGQRKLVSFFPG